jgi:hypothetical protein
MYDIEHGKVSIQDWWKHVLRYHDGQFLEDSLFGLFLYNTIRRHASNREGNFFSQFGHIYWKRSTNSLRIAKAIRAEE